MFRTLYPSLYPSRRCTVVSLEDKSDEVEELQSFKELPLFFGRGPPRLSLGDSTRWLPTPVNIIPNIAAQTRFSAITRGPRRNNCRDARLSRALVLVTHDV
jgi:hypothetical protein